MPGNYTANGSGHSDSIAHKERACIEVYRRWKSLRDHLSAAIHDYMDACNALVAIDSSPTNSHPHRAAFEQIYTRVNQELPHLVQEEEKLAAGRALLGIFRNRSSNICPINMLPTEILANIFTLASFSCIRGNDSNKSISSTCPRVLASVCTRWRQTAIGTCRLWTHIDLSVSNQNLYRRAQLWLKMAKSSPLHIHVHQRNCAKAEEIAQLTHFLIPYMKQSWTLYLDAECYSMELFEAILGCWVRFGLPGSTKALILHRPQPISLLAILDPTQPLYTRYSCELDPFLRPVRALHLRNVCVRWGTTAYHGLSELHLDSLPDSARPTIRQLVSTLHASPRLCSLKLARLNFRHEAVEDSSEIEPVQLTHLVSLNLLEASSSVLKTLLPLITPGTTPLSMSMSLDKPEFIRAEITSFFERSNISTLYVDAWGYNWFSTVFGSLQHLKVLALRNYYLSRDTIPEPATTSVGEVAPICVRLRSLAFIGCRLGWEPLRELVAAHSSSLQSLDIWRSKLSFPLAPHDRALGGDRKGLESLLGRVPHVRYSCDLNDYPVRGWSVCDGHNGGNVVVPG